ncbi:ATP-NAD kinase-like domain-containing protein [Aspergillus transmontanensis]|uniref:ATP-NAD kinase-like domain-containing protein n=1 Tax=Aspergillus transmontanensis TaxID=1034304 RepID=A0A5N6VII5_9EURO|nr:ATP-NAD kinase-like domain-containing protein [Aspergillus transmontanensis]
MSKVIFTPWKEQLELQSVRNQFYPPPTYDGPDMRSRACATVAAWKLRGNLPHPVEATALLTDAILHDDAKKNSIFSIRATYSAAFCRFVTGLVDSKLHGQRKTMFQRAIDLGLPASFVELRHEATHRELPSLTVLRNAAQRSLEWLWDYYWAKIDLNAGFAPDGVEDGIEPVKAAARACLAQVTGETGASEQPRKKRRVQVLSGVATQLVSVCKSSGKGAAAVSEVLVEDGVLVSGERKLGTSLDDDFSRWDYFLQVIVEGYPAFLTGLVEAMVDVLAFARSATKEDAQCEGVYMWLDHIICSSQWESKRRLLSFAYALSACEWICPPGQEKDARTPRDTLDDAMGFDDTAIDTDGVTVTDMDDWTPKQSETIVESRQLTKKQLSDMAWNVRKLSKKLDSIKLKLSVKNVFVVTKAGDDSVIAFTRKVTQWLLSKDRDTKYHVYVERRLEAAADFGASQLLEDEPSAAGRLKFWDNKFVYENAYLFDFVITLGGDGTVLYTSWLFQQVVPPVLSFSLGSLGFLTKFDFNDYQKTLGSAFKDGVAVSLRLRFECTIMRSNGREDGSLTHSKKRDLVEELIGEEVEGTLTHKPEKVVQILNDVVLDRGPNPTMSSIELFGDDEHFTTLLADGVCIATPTGSTAYNLAAGGSLCHPDNPVILVTAICAHTLSFRPIILPDTIVLRMGVPYDARTSSWASFDGRERVELHPGDYVTVSASRYPFANVLPQDRRNNDWLLID